MEKFNNWNSWCNDKIVVTSKEGDRKALINVNCIMHIEDDVNGTVLFCTDQYSCQVKESIEDILGMISEVLAESKARKEAAEKAEEERLRAQYETYAKATADDSKASQG